MTIIAAIIIIIINAIIIIIIIIAIIFIIITHRHERVSGSGHIVRIDAVGPLNVS